MADYGGGVEGVLLQVRGRLRGDGDEGPNHTPFQVIISTLLILLLFLLPSCFPIGPSFFS